MEEAVSNQDALESYTDAVMEMGRLILEGRSFSGRERHCAYLNTGAARFANISAVSGLDFPDDGRGMVTTDWDFDGDVDLWVSNRTAPRLRFLRNDTGAGNRFLAFRLTGNGTSSNRDAIGARLTLATDAGAQMRTLKAGEGFLSQSSRWLHFGLGRQGSVRSLVVRWPDGSEQTFSDLEPDTFYEIEQGESAPTVYTPPRDRIELVPSEVEIPASTQAMRLRLAARTPLPRLPYRDLEGRERNVREHLDKPLLLNLWASWCLPCRTELAELDGAGAHVLALSLDGLNEHSPTTYDDARQFLRTYGYGFEAGFADLKLVQILQAYHQAFFLDRRPFPVPTSFLIDTDGNVAAIYRGPVTAAALADDIAHINDDPEDRLARAVPFGGRWAGEPPNVAPLELARAMIAEDLLTETIQYLEEFETDRESPLWPQVLMELSMRLRRNGMIEQAEVMAGAARRLRSRQSTSQ